MGTRHIRLAGMLKRLGLVPLGVIFGFMALEAAARFLHPTPQAGSFYRLDEVTGWSHVPGAQGWYLGARTGEFRVWARINTKGLHDREIPYERQGEALRILTLGDSFTAALEVPLEQTFSKALENELNQSRSRRRYVVINSGVGGWGTDNQLLFYRHEGKKYGPDLVLLVFYFDNDIFDNYPESKLRFSSYAKPHFVLENGSLRLRNFPYDPSVAQRLRWEANKWLSSLKVYRAGARAWDLALAGVLGRPLTFREALEAREEDLSSVWERAWAVTRSLLQELRREIEGSGASLVVVVAPPKEALDPAPGENGNSGTKRRDSFWDPERRETAVVDFLHRDGFRFVRLLPALRESLNSDKKPLYFKLDRHLNADGHRVTAEVIRRYLVTEALLP